MSSAKEAKYVCSRCVTDHYLKELLQTNAGPNRCSFCDSRRAADFGVLFNCLESTVNHFYNNAVEELPWDSREGGFQGENFDSYELMQEHLSDWTDDSSLLDEVAGQLDDCDWCERDSFALKKYEALSYGWEAFCGEVKHKTRFLFFQSAISGQQYVAEVDGLQPHEMLEQLGLLFVEHELIQMLPVGTRFFRARIVTTGERPTGGAELGTVPRHLANMPNRMSPAGIPMFYGAFDPDTAILETFEPRRGRGREVAIGEFESRRPLRVVDLSSLPPVPSRFDAELRDRIDPIRFLHALEADLTKSIVRDGRAHVEYSPTQVVTEYVRHRLRLRDNDAFDGIVYRSSKDHRSRAVVIFADPEHCGPTTAPPMWGAPATLLDFVGAAYLAPPFKKARVRRP